MTDKIAKLADTGFWIPDKTDLGFGRRKLPESSFRYHKKSRSMNGSLHKYK